jgi:hypothetical protein
MTTSDTFHVIPVGLLPNPGTCSICGSNQRDCLDWGITVEYFGAILICVECVRDLVNVPELGLMHESEVSAMMEDNLRLTARDREMESVRRDLRAALAAVADGFDHRIIKSVPDAVVTAKVPEKVTRSLF